MRNWKLDTHQLRLEHLERRDLLAADVYISEFVASNESSLLDEDGDSPDWLEIYNDGPDNVNLDGWHLTDDIDESRKWSFPAQDLPAGNFLVVFLSDKDRTTPGMPLHANFKLKADGEYLSLNRDSTSSTVEVVSSFAPTYPSQLTDISFGFDQTVSVNQISSPSATARYFVPQNNTLGTTWTAPNFDDASWQLGTAGLGYQQTVPGFTVQDAKSNGRIVNLSEAISALDGTGQASQTILISPTINFVDQEGGGGIGNFDNDVDFPNNQPGDDNDFAIRATGTITIPNSGTWSFGINSDDGARLRIGGETVINDDTLHAPRDTIRRANLTAGDHDLELVFFERGGGAEVELFAAEGIHTSFNDQFELVGDVQAGGLHVATSPSGSVTGFGQLYATDISQAMFDESSSIYVRIPVTVESPQELESLSLQMNYDDGYVAYLNGEEIARRNAPVGVLTDQATASGDRFRNNAESIESIDITQHLGLLKAGENTLAIHGLNSASDADEFVLAAGLAEVKVVKGDTSYFTEPSPGTFNPASGVDGFLADEVTLSHEHGFYDEPFSLSISTPTPDTDIVYTLDGSEPTQSNGTQYTQPLAIEETTTVRVGAFKQGFFSSNVTTATYVFLSDVVTQSADGQAPEGFPTSRNINGQALDYGMDPAIVNHNTWGPQLEDALKQVPSLSLVLDIDDLLGSQNGIYTHARSHGKAWERPASLELLNPDGTDGFQVNAGVRIRGGFSRSGNNPKHAFRFFFRDEYGDAKLEFPLFGDEGADEFDKIDLRTTQNYSWAFQGNSNNAFVRDVFARDMQRELGQPYTRSRFYHLYINGQYWGLFQTQERAEARFAETYFGGDKDNYDVIKSAGSTGGYRNEATDGSLDAYRRLADYFYQTNGLSDANLDDYYRAQGMNPDGTANPEFERLLDVENLIDYMIITYYTGDRDGPVSRFVDGLVNNYFAIYNREDPDGFKFFEHDSEHSLDRGFEDLALRVTSSGRDFGLFNPLWMHEQLASSNTEYRIQFSDTVKKYFTNDGVMTAENAKALIDARAAEIDQAIIAESARWGDAQRSSPATKTTWEGAVDGTKAFFDGRVDEVIRQFRTLGWYPESNPPTLLVDGETRFSGELDTTDEITMVSETSVDFSESLVRATSRWRFLDDGSNQRTAWRAMDFDDSEWDDGRAELGYGDGGENTVVDFGGDSSDKHITTYFRRSFDVDDASAIDALKLSLRRDDGAVVYLNGEEVVRSNMPSGTITYTTRASSVTNSGTPEQIFSDYTFDASPLRDGTNVLAVEVHQVSPTSSDISFDLALVGGATTRATSEIYYTVDGSDPRLPGGATSSNAIRFDGSLRLSSSAQIVARTKVGDEWSAASTAAFQVDSSSVAGDFNNDAIVDANDIDILAAKLRDGTADREFDLDGNGTVNEGDFDYLIETILGTKRGDTDLDGDVDFNDFLKLAANFGSSNAGWAQGNFDLDTEVDFLDFVVMASNFDRE